MHQQVLSLILIIAANSLFAASHEQVAIDCNNNKFINVGQKWTEHVCSEREFDLENLCEPTFFRTAIRQPSDDAESITPPLKGLIVAVHGFSQCPGVFEQNQFVKSWLDAGYDVILPLLPGHGRNATNYCVGLRRFNPSKCGIRLFSSIDDRIDGLPLDSQGWVDFSDLVNEFVLEEKGRYDLGSSIDVSILGMSLGCSVTSLAAHTGPQGLYEKMICLCGSFGVSASITERNLFSLLEGVASFQNSFLEILGFPLRNMERVSGLFKAVGDVANLIFVLSSEDWNSFNIVWRAVAGLISLPYIDKCSAQLPPDELGFCITRLRNVFALSAFGLLATEASGKYGSSQVPRVQFVSTEADFGNRLATTAEIYKSIARLSKSHNTSPDVTLSHCIYRRVPDCEGDGNECVVPHFVTSIPVNEAVAPFEAYWLPALRDDILKFFETSEEIGVDPSPVVNRSECVKFPLEEFDDLPDAFLLTNRLVYIRFESAVTVTPNNLLQLERFLGLPEQGLSVWNTIQIVLQYSKNSNVGFGRITEVPFQVLSPVPEETLARWECEAMSGAWDFLFTGTISELEISGRRPVSRVDGIRLGCTGV